MAIVVLEDDGGDRAFGHYLAQPERRGFFLKHLTTVLDATSSEKSKPVLLHTRTEPSSAGKMSESTRQHSVTTPSPSVPASSSSTRAPDDSPASQDLASTPSARVRTPASSPTPLPPDPPVRDRTNQTSSRAARGPLHPPAPPAAPQVVQAGVMPAGRRDHHEEAPPSCSPEVLRAAKQIGLELGCNDVMLWLAENAARAELPDGWIAFDDDAGRPAYYQEKRKLVVRQHPMLARYQSYAARIRNFYQRMSEKQALDGVRKIRAHLAVVLNEALNRCHRELPSITPEMLERASLLLAIDTSSEFGLSTKARR